MFSRRGLGKRRWDYRVGFRRDCGVCSVARGWVEDGRCVGVEGKGKGKGEGRKVVD